MMLYLLKAVQLSFLQAEDMRSFLGLLHTWPQMKVEDDVKKNKTLLLGCNWSEVFIEAWILAAKLSKSLLLWCFLCICYKSHNTVFSCWHILFSHKIHMHPSSQLSSHISTPYRHKYCMCTTYSSDFTAGQKEKTDCSVILWYCAYFLNLVHVNIL